MKKVKTYVLFLYFGLYMIVAMLREIKLGLIRKFGNEDQAEEYVKKCVLNWANFIVKTVGIKINVIGKENIINETGLYVANHQSNFDIPVVLSAFDKTVGFVAKKEMETIPVISYWMKNIKCTFMDRTNPREAIKSINEGVQNLKNGYSMVIFPEGTRSKKDEIGEFKKGSMKLGTKAGVPIIPVTIDGTYKALEGNNNIVQKAEVNIIVHKPIYQDTLSKEEISNLSENIKEIIKAKV